MGDIGIRFYFFDGDKIMKVGVDTKKRFPALAGRQVPWVTVFFLRSTKEIQSIRFDPANINTAGEWKDELEGKYAAQAPGPARKCEVIRGQRVLPKNF
jgi:hypothetical protein